MQRQGLLVALVVAGAVEILMLVAQELQAKATLAVMLSVVMYQVLVEAVEAVVLEVLV
jgi:hypothetical protein